MIYLVDEDVPLGHHPSSGQGVLYDTHHRLVVLREDIIISWQLTFAMKEIYFTFKGLASC